MSGSLDRSPMRGQEKFFCLLCAWGREGWIPGVPELPQTPCSKTREVPFWLLFSQDFNKSLLFFLMCSPKGDQFQNILSKDGSQDSFALPSASQVASSNKEKKNPHSYLCFPKCQSLLDQHLKAWDNFILLLHFNAFFKIKVSYSLPTRRSLENQKCCLEILCMIS